MIVPEYDNCQKLWIKSSQVYRKLNKKKINRMDLCSLDCGVGDGNNKS